MSPFGSGEAAYVKSGSGAGAYKTGTGSMIYRFGTGDFYVFYSAGSMFRRSTGFSKSRVGSPFDAVAEYNTAMTQLQTNTWYNQDPRAQERFVYNYTASANRYDIFYEHFMGCMRLDLTAIEGRQIRRITVPVTNVSARSFYIGIQQQAFAAITQAWSWVTGAYTVSSSTTGPTFSIDVSLVAQRYMFLIHRFADTCITSANPPPNISVTQQARIFIGTEPTTVQLTGG